MPPDIQRPDDASQRLGPSGRQAGLKHPPSSGSLPRSQLETWSTLLALHELFRARVRRELEWFEAHLDFNAEAVADLRAEAETFAKLIARLWRRAA
jgi:hypothetical protein